GEQAFVTLVDHPPHERADQLHRHARTLVRGYDRERGAPRLTSLHEREEVADRAAFLVERDEARVVVELAAQAQVMRTQRGLAHRAEHVLLQRGEPVEVVGAERTHLVSSHGDLLLEITLESERAAAMTPDRRLRELCPCCAAVTLLRRIRRTQRSW